MAIGFREFFNREYHAEEASDIARDIDEAIECFPGFVESEEYPEYFEGKIRITISYDEGA